MNGSFEFITFNRNVACKICSCNAAITRDPFNSKYSQGLPTSPIDEKKNQNIARARVSLNFRNFMNKHSLSRPQKLPPRNIQRRAETS